ncbi:hypothetical protein C8R46DRAFT_1102080 [Mycena filopes]|nr:hypothetical protein C8R46DRAFT_1102080 [Mycena filopes]
MLDLPQELVDRIIDDLHDDWHSLAGCGLVCWAWVPASRVHLFSDITLRRDWRRIMHPQFRPFIDMLATGSATFAPFVSRLSLQHLDATSTAGEEFHSSMSILSNLNAITSLEFKHWRALGSQPVQNLLPRLTGLSELILDHVVIDSVGRLFGMLEMCPALTSLTVTATSWGSGDSESSHISYSHAGSIRTLRLMHTCIFEFLDAFTHHQSQLNCKTVDIRGITPEDTASVGRFLDCVVGGLQRLRVGFDYDFDAQEELAGIHFDLRNATQLTTFYFDEILPGVPKPTTVLSTVKCALASPSLTNIIFSLSSYWKEDLEAFPWRELDAILSSAPVDTLQTVEFRVRGAVHRPLDFFQMVEEFAMKSLPRSGVRLNVKCTRC